MFDVSYQILKAIRKGGITFVQLTEATKYHCLLNLPYKLHINVRQVRGLWLHSFDLLTIESHAAMLHLAKLHSKAAFKVKCIFAK